jgi:hypothetical protein
MKNKARQETIERANHKRRLRRTLDLSNHPGFGWEPGYYLYNHFGVEVRLRFSQETYEWTAKCPHLKIETSFPHQPPQDIQNLLNDWILDNTTYIGGASFRTRLRRSTPAVRNFAKKYRLSLADADEMMQERAL